MYAGKSRRDWEDIGIIKVSFETIYDGRILKLLQVILRKRIYEFCESNFIDEDVLKRL